MKGCGKRFNLGHELRDYNKLYTCGQIALRYGKKQRVFCKDCSQSTEDKK